MSGKVRLRQTTSSLGPRLLPVPQASSAYRSPKHDRPQIDIDYSPDCHYWIISIKCRDRTKLLFDTGGWVGASG